MTITATGRRLIEAARRALTRETSASLSVEPLSSNPDLSMAVSCQISISVTSLYQQISCYSVLTSVVSADQPRYRPARQPPPDPEPLRLAVLTVKRAIILRK